MALITDPDLLVVNTEITVNTGTKQITLNVAGNLVAKDGVTMQAMYSKLIELWDDAAYNAFEFPMYAIDVRSGQFIMGFDGANYNGWKFSNDASRTYIRNGAWSEYSSGGVLNRRYFCAASLGTVSSGAQLYYQKASGGSASNFTYTDAVNEAIQIYGDASNGNFDSQTYFKVFCREQGKTYDEAALTDVGETASGAFKVQFPIANLTDSKIQDSDVNVAANAPYTGITVTYYGVDQNRTIGGVSYPFRIIVEGNGASKEDIYTKIQYLLRQNSDIDSGAGSVIGKTAAALMSFSGDTLVTATGVYIDNFDINDINAITFTDQNGVARNFPFQATGTLLFNSFLTAGGTGYYRMYFTTNPAGNYPGGSAVTVNDATSPTPVAIAGTITGSSIAFTFDYDANVQGGRTAGTDASVTVVAGNAGSGKPVVATATIGRSTGQNISLTAEQDRAYQNP